MTEKYYKELARVLKGHNIETDKFEYDNMNVVHNGNIICNLLPNGGIQYETAVMQNQDAAEIIYQAMCHTDTDLWTLYHRFMSKRQK